jgi:hypothetical protein
MLNLGNPISEDAWRQVRGEWQPSRRCRQAKPEEHRASRACLLRRIWQRARDRSCPNNIVVARQAFNSSSPVSKLER